MPPQKASANPIAIPVAGGVSAAVYVYSALALAAAYGVTQIDEDTGTAIANHATSVYNGMNSIAKSAWDSMVDAMTTTENPDYSRITLNSTHNTSLRSTLNTTYSARDLSTVTLKKISDFSYSSYAYTYDTYIANVMPNYYLEDVKVYVNNGADKIVTGVMVRFLKAGATSTTGYFLYSDSTGVAYPGLEFLRNRVSIETLGNALSIKSMVNAAINMHYATNPSVGVVDIPTGSIGLNIPTFPTLETNATTGEKLKVGVPLPTMDAGIVWDGAFPILDTVNPTAAPNITTGETGAGTGTGEYGGILGNITDFLGSIGDFISNILDYLKDILAKIWETIKSILAALGVLAALTAIKDFLTSTLQGLITGINTAVTSIAEFFSQGLLGNLDFKWSKLKAIYIGFTTAFPFSLPWDVGRAFDSIFGNFSDTSAPEWKMTVYGQSWTIKIPNMLLGWFPITRMMLLIMFDIGLVYSVRKLLGGAS